MVPESNPAGNPQRIILQCPCGKRLSALPQHAGKRLKCPGCGEALLVPRGSSPPPTPVSRQVEIEPEGMSKNTLIVLWSTVGLVVVGAVLFLVWHSRSLQQAKIAAANDRISQAVAAANEWMTRKSLRDGDAIEQQLADALHDEVATQRGTGDSLLSEVRKRRDQLAEQVRIEQSQREAAALFNDAKRQIEARRITDASALLRRYVAHPHATEKPDAQRLLDEMETATSDALTLDALIALSNDDFSRVKAGGAIEDGRVTHPVVVAARNETVHRNVDKALQRREEIRIADEKRKETERLAAMQRQRQDEERRKQAGEQQKLVDAKKPLRLFVGGEVSGELAAYFRMLPQPSLAEVTKNQSGSVFDKSDQPKWDSKYQVGSILLTPGALMDISVANYSEDVVFGQHSEWSWTITVVTPDANSLYDGVSFDFAIGDEVVSKGFRLVGTARGSGATQALYKYQEEFRIGGQRYYVPVDPILKQLAGSGAVKYRLKTGPPVVGVTAEGELSPEIISAIRGLIARAKYKNPANRE